VKEEREQLAKIASQKALDAIKLVEASLSYIKPYDVEKTYTPREREPYDALNDRFTRAVEVCIKFFRSYELYMYGESSETFRDLLNRMENQKICRRPIRERPFGHLARSLLVARAAPSAVEIVFFATNLDKHG
jgi:hypothetical protein